MENGSELVTGVGAGLKCAGLEVVARHKPGFCDTLSGEYTLMRFASGVRLTVYAEALLWRYDLYPESAGPFREAELRLTYPAGPYQGSLILNAFKLDTLKIHFNKQTQYGRLGLTV
jgi:hypothetical protein